MRAYSRFLVLILGFFVVVAAANVAPAAAADFAFMMKSGNARLWDDKQTLDSVERHFDHSSSKNFGLAWEIRNAQDVGLGMEYLTYQHDYTPPTTGTSKSQYFMFSAKKYYGAGSIFYPYVGAGAGLVHAKINDGQGNIDRDTNLALMATAGLELRFAESFGFFAEFKGLASGTDGEDDNEFDASATGFMAGVSFIF